MGPEALRPHRGDRPVRSRAAAPLHRESGAVVIAIGIGVAAWRLVRSLVDRAPSWDRIGKLAAIAVLRTALDDFLMLEMRSDTAKRELPVEPDAVASG